MILNKNLFVLMLVIEAVSLSVCDVVCGPGDTYLPDPVNCGSFYQCSNGSPTLIHCPPPLVFSPIFNVCVWSYEYDCQISTTEDTSTITMTVEPSSPSTEPTSTTTQPSLPTEEPSSTTEDTSTVTMTTDPSSPATEPTSTTTQALLPTDEPSPSPTESLPTTLSTAEPTTESSPSTSEPPSCEVVCGPLDEDVSNPCDCNSFYKCANGVPLLLECPATHEGDPPLVFNPISSECVYPHQYDCQITTTEDTSTVTESSTEPSPTSTESSSTSTESSSTSTESSSTSTESSSTSTEPSIVPPTTSTTPPTTSTEPPTTSTEPPTTSIEPSTTSIEPSTTSTEPPPNACQVVCGPTDGYIPNPCDCSSFYRCASGVPELFHCEPTQEGEPPLVFSPILNECVRPNEYDCRIFHPCHEFDHPTSCLRSTNNCSFCFDGCFPNRSRCDTYENLQQAGCQSFSLDESQYDSVVNTSTNCSTWVPVEPGRKRNISVTFSLKKHPLDLYYLMDFSGSMDDDKVNLVSLSSALLNALTNLTNDFHIGFGTFVDKPIPPFGFLSDYSFHHTLTLTSVTGDFVEKIANTPILNGMDAPEAHGDALAQVVECAEQIGWRDDARRVVLLATDVEFHIAGDGPLGGIFDPYVDGCYLDTQGSYSKELTMDYPSVEQLASAYSKNQAVTTVIFATDVMSIGFYENVASQFRSAYVAVLNYDSSNIIDLLKNEFEKINSRMEIEKSDTSDSVYFRYFSSCMGTGGDEETAICENLPASGEVTFIVEIDMPECPIDENETGMIIDFNPVGLPISIELELSFLCN